MAVAEVHVHVADFHLGAGNLRGEANGHALVGLHANHDGVLTDMRVLDFTKERACGLLENHGNLGDSTAQTLAGAQVEGGAFPAAVGDGELQRCEGFGAGVGGNVLLVEEAVDVLAALVACGVLSDRERVRQVVDAHGLEDLRLFGAQVLGVQAEGLLHCGEGEQLQQVVLDDVAGRTHAVVVACAGADADVLGHRDLHVVHVVGVPERLEHLVGETHRQDVLNGFLTQVVVDAEHGVGREDRLHDGVQLARALQVVTEGLLDDHAAPTVDGVDGVGIVRCQAVLGQLGEDLLEGLRGDGEVEGVVAVCATLVELGKGALEFLEGGVVIKGALDESHTLLELVPNVLAEGGAGVCLNGLTHVVAEVVVAPGAAAEADEAEARREQTAVHEVIHCRKQLLTGQVAGHAEEDERGRARDAGDAAVARVPQGVRFLTESHNIFL